MRQEAELECMQQKLGHASRYHTTTPAGTLTNGMAEPYLPGKHAHDHVVVCLGDGLYALARSHIPSLHPPRPLACLCVFDPLKRPYPSTAEHGSHSIAQFNKHCMPHQETCRGGGRAIQCQRHSQQAMQPPIIARRRMCCICSKQTS